MRRVAVVVTNEVLHVTQRLLAEICNTCRRINGMFGSHNTPPDMTVEPGDKWRLLDLQRRRPRNSSVIDATSPPDHFPRRVVSLCQ